MIKKHASYLKYCFALFMSAITFSPAEAQQVEVGTGTTVSVFSPICRTRDYSVYEIIYLNTELNISGSITDFAFHRSDGTDVDPIQDVSLFMKHATDSLLPAGTYSETGFQLVYQGNWPNDTGDGWREVVLSNPFVYDGVSNLQVLVKKGYQASVANPPVTPRWYYTNNGTGSNRARRYMDNMAIDSATSLTSINFNANARFTFGTVGVREIGNIPVSVFPNPASEFLSINLNSTWKSEDLSFELIDFGGRIVHVQSIDENMNIPISHLAPGIYFYSLRSRDSVWSEKLIIQ